MKFMESDNRFTYVQSMSFGQWALQVILTDARFYGHNWYNHISRRSHQSSSMKIGVFENFTKFTEKHMYQSLFFNKAFLKETLAQVFPVNFAKFLRILLLLNTFKRLLLDLSAMTRTVFTSEGFQSIASHKFFTLVIQ